ncbi:MAG: S1C family serine protease, partial [Thermomicrobiales bacterium]
CGRSARAPPARPGIAAAPAAPKAAAMSAEDVVARVGPAVVTVINEQRYKGSDLTPVGSGTGFIIDDQGHVVTNWHVVDGGEQFEVTFADGETRKADLVGSDRISDLAVIRVEGGLPATVPLGDSDALRPGQSVLAIGSPLGSFTNTVTEGIVSAVGRDFPFASGPQNYTNLIQHDAAINPGNSGGPLFNLAGEVVGVNTLGIPTDEAGQPVQGLFFAIPSNTVAKIAGKLIGDGQVVYPYFGIEFANVTPEVAARLKLPVANGVVVQTGTADGPAAAAGLQVGDVVLAIDGVKIDQKMSFAEVLFGHQPDETVTATVQRGDRQIDLEVTLGTRPDGV